MDDFIPDLVDLINNFDPAAYLPKIDSILGCKSRGGIPVLLRYGQRGSMALYPKAGRHRVVGIGSCFKRCDVSGQRRFPGNGRNADAG